MEAKETATVHFQMKSNSPCIFKQEPSIYQDIYVILFMVMDGVFDGVCLLKTTNC